jgi:hypothetical protein
MAALTKLAVQRDQPVLLAGGVGVVALGGQAGLDDLRAELGEGADGVQHHRCALEQRGQRLGGVQHFHHFVFRGFDACDVGLHRCVQLLGAAPRGDEGDAVLAQVFAHQPAGVAGGAIDDDGFLAAHEVSPGL